MLDLLKNSLNVNVLGEEQMLSISGAGTCAAYIPANYISVIDVGNDGATGDDLVQVCPCVQRNLSKEDAIRAASTTGGRWCCDSCSSASWY